MSTNKKDSSLPDKPAVLHDVLNYIHRGDVLDIGCGQGTLSAYLSRNGFTVTAVDINNDAISKLKESYPLLIDRGKIIPILSDIKKCNFHINSFDLVLAVSVLHFLPKEEVVLLLQKISRWIKQDGLFFIRIFESKNGGNFTYLPNEQQFLKKVQENNFKIIEYNHYHIKDKEGHQHWVIDCLLQK